MAKVYIIFVSRVISADAVEEEDDELFNPPKMHTWPNNTPLF